MSYLYWNKMIQDQNPDLLVRVEDAEVAVLQFLKAGQIVPRDRKLAAPPPKTIDSNAPTRGELPDKSKLENVDWDEVDSGLQRRLNDLCLSLGYAPLDEL